MCFSLGTDTAGSGRVPAMFNKLWGVKPSRGRLSTSGVVPACRTLDCVSIFAFNAEDSQLLLSLTEGYDEADAYAQPTRDVGLPGTKRLGVPKPEQLLFFGDVDYRQAWADALEVQKKRGWDIVEIDFEPFLKAARLLYEGPWISERYAALETFLNECPEAFWPTTRAIISGGANPSAKDAFSAIYKLADLRRASLQAWQGIDAIITPTAGGFPLLRDLEADPLGPNSQLGYYTNFMNLLDLCAVAVPAGETVEGMPFGLTWIAPRDTDKALIKIASSGPGHHAQPSEGTTASILLFGAHLTGLPLNGQIVGLGGEFVAEVKTAAKYRMVYLPEPAPPRPGILRVESGGAEIAAEEWRMPVANLGKFLTLIQQPLGLGQIELSDGRKVLGFLCEAVAANAAKDISERGGWRAFLAKSS